MLVDPGVLDDVDVAAAVLGELALLVTLVVVGEEGVLEVLDMLAASKDPFSAPTCGLPAVEAGEWVMAEMLADGNAAGPC